MFTTTLALNAMLLAFPIPRDREAPDKGPGFLGITFESADADQAVQVTEVRPEGPADKSGLRGGDIIRKFNGEPVNFGVFATKIIRIRPGTVVPVEVYRGAHTVTLKVKIGLRPEDFPYALPDLRDPNMPQDELLPPNLPPQ